MDLAGISALAAAAAATAGAFRLARRSRWRCAVALLVLAGALLRLNAAAHTGLGPWDERFHALVARNLLDHPLEPTLVERPLFDRPPGDWAATRVWLQKPPFALWLIALSLRAFGDSELALRVPSVALGSLAVAFGFALARHFVGARAAFFAAAFHAWHGRSALLAGGFFASDHVDTVFVFLVELGVWLALRAAAALGGAGPAAAPRLLGAGLATGLAWLTWSAPALVIPGVFFVELWLRVRSWRLRLLAPSALLLVAAAVVTPWLLYTAREFPEAFAHASRRNLQHLARVVDGHAHPWYFHLANLPLHFGWLAWLPLGAFALEGLRRRRDWLPLLAWFAVGYGVFSAAATKLPSYVLFASPVIWCALGWFCAEGARAWPRRVARVAVAGVVAAYALGSSFAAQSEDEVWLRDPTWAQELRWLGARVAELPPGPWVVFGVDSPIECMYYARATCAAGLPGDSELAAARARGLRVAIYGDAEAPEHAALRARPELRFLDLAPVAAPARALLAELRRQGLERATLFNAARPRDLEEYLKRSIDVRVFGGAPRARRVRAGRPVVLLQCPGDAAIAARAATDPRAGRLVSSTLAAPSDPSSDGRCTS